MREFRTKEAFKTALFNLPEPVRSSVEAATSRQAALTKPARSLGRLEDIAIFMAGWQGRERPCLDRVQAIVFAGDHGVASRGVSAFPQEVTQQMVANFRAGGAAINALSRVCGACLSVVDLTGDGPTKDMTEEPAMSRQECLAALSAGASAVRPGTELLFVGEMGIANTTAASAICAQSFGERAVDWIGRGSGAADAMLGIKREAVETAIRLHTGQCSDGFETLRHLGGREIAAMAGAILAARHLRIPVLLDGFICTASILPFALANRAFLDHCLAAHRSNESGHGRLLDRLRLRPLLDLDMRLGEGTGAAIAVQIVRSALAAHNEMATFAEASVSGAS